ncbi:lipase family protein [Nocardioides stalactiti]|uniref:lipase family protein n=1 Tax=Nocardioides stalactiti TaxID=2755356 RepID=UPI001600A736|nr:lipase family protein [Nocardioides stalactiti]
MLRRLLAALIALVALAALTAVLTGPSAPSAGAAGGIPVPDEDPFYAQPADLAASEPGDVLDSREVEVNAYSMPLPVQAWQVKYRSEDNSGRPTANVTTIMVPDRPWTGAGPRPLLSYQTAEDSAGTHCAPSYGLRAGFAAPVANAESGLMAMALNRGWAVVVPDYQGPDSQFLGGYGEARGVLDSLTAVRDFAPAGVQDSPIGMTGYSGGAVATTWAAQYQRALAPGLPIRAVSLGGVVADYRSTIKQFDLLGLDGIVMMGVATVSRSYPAENLTSNLNARGMEVLRGVERACIHEAQARYPLVRLNQLTKVPNVLDTPPIVAFLRRISPLGYAGNPMAPVFMYHATLDELAPIRPARELFRRFCAAGVAVKKVETPLGEHFSETVRGFPSALRYLDDRFAGKPAPSSC